MRRSPHLLVGTFLALAVSFVPRSLAQSDDGIDLRLTNTDPTVALDWTGGALPFRVHRSSVASSVMDPSNKIADTDFRSYVDSPPEGGVLFYFVTADPNLPPVADAGPDPSHRVDVDADGFETVLLDGSASADPDGVIVFFEWKEGAEVLAAGPSPTAEVTLAVGTHVLTLGVTDDRESSDSDEVSITIAPGSSASHPKLILAGTSFQAMRDRAASEPWASMRADAIATSDAGYVPGGDNYEISQNLTRFSSASALAYVLDYPDARLYATRVRDAILDHVDSLVFGTSWITVVPPAHALFNLTLALDVVYNHLTPSEVVACETKMQEKVDDVWTGGWSSAGLGAVGTWDVYTGARTTPDDDYHGSLMDDLSQDGIHFGGLCYGWARWAGASRYVKNMYMDVLEYTGVDRRYYGNRRIAGIYAWLYGHGDAVFGGPIPFGDCAIQAERNQTYDEPPLYRAEKFGLEVGQYAASQLPSEIAGNLLSYVVPDSALPPPVYAGSRIYPDGGGFFKEAVASPQDRPVGMGGALWNVMGSEDHSHYEVNAVAINGYNEYLLINSGYSGWGNAPAGYTWSWIHDDERSGNTLRTSRHASKAGGGVVEGFSDTLFDYASGDDGPALADDVHFRNFVFVHADGTSLPYFVLFDEVYAEGGEVIRMNLHPNTLATTGIRTEVAGTEYTAPIDGVAVVPNRANLTVFYATPPNVVRHLNGGIATSSVPGGGFEGRYLETEYTAPANGEKNLLTILVPHDIEHPKAGMTRLSVADSTGARIDHAAGTFDYAFESTGLAPLTHEGVAFVGRALLCRKGTDGSNVFYFVRKGTSFRATGDAPVGFDSASLVSAYMRGTRGRVVSPGTIVRFTYPGVVGVDLDGSPVSIVASGPDWVEVDVPSGTHGVDLRIGE